MKIHSKNLKTKSRYCNANVLQLIIASVIAEFPTCNWQLYLCNILPLQKQIESNVFVLSVFQFIWQGLVIAFKSFNRRKKYVLIIGIWWMHSTQLTRCSAKVDILQNSCLTEYKTGCMIKIFEKYQWRSPIWVKLKVYSLQL